jgi:hypothetical protein
MQLKEISLVALHWQAACCILSQKLRRQRQGVFVLIVNQALAGKGHSVNIQV